MFGKEGKWPYAPFHPPFEDRQHTSCPDTGFDPILLDLSGLLSPFRHCRRLFVPISEHRASTCVPWLRRHYPASTLLWTL